MKKIINKHRKVTRQLMQGKYLPLTVFIFAFSGLGLVMLIRTFAATNTAYFEAESASVSGNASIVSDSQASAGKALKFNESETSEPPTSYPEPMWHGDEETDFFTSDATHFWRRNETRNGNPSRFQIVADPKGLFGKVYRAQITPAELAAGDKRAEYAQATIWPEDEKLRLANSSTPRGSTENIYFGWRSMFGPDVLVDGGSNNGNYMQLKGDSSCGGPAIGMTIKYGRLTLRSEQYLTEHKNIAWNGPQMSTLYNQWHDIVLHVNFAKDYTGYLEVWFNGVKQTMVNGQSRIYFPTVCPNDTYIFPKLGVYSFDSPAPGNGPVHWFDSPRIGTSYDSVVPR